jgi:hypothetical protein
MSTLFLAKGTSILATFLSINQGSNGVDVMFVVYGNNIKFINGKQ